MFLKNKRILITAGPTWVPIDKVRVISNLASGETGRLLAKEARKAGAKVTLLIGPLNFNELKDKITKNIKRCDIIIHAAAVADFCPARVYSGKINAAKRNLVLKLRPLPKIIDAVKKINPGIFLVGFKFEPDASRAKLRQKAQTLFKRAKADLVVANSVVGGGYRAYILGKNIINGPFFSKGQLARHLISTICQNLN